MYARDTSALGDCDHIPWWRGVAKASVYTVRTVGSGDDSYSSKDFLLQLATIYDWFKVERGQLLVGFRPGGLPAWLAALQTIQSLG